MPTQKLHRAAALGVMCVCVLALAAASSCALPLSVFAGSAPPDGLAEINSECWDAASLALIKAQRMRAADGVVALWDFMTQLRASPQTQHQELFMKLAQAFWKRYVECVLSRAHGLGRRRSPYVFGNIRETHFKPVHRRKTKWLLH